MQTIIVRRWFKVYGYCPALEIEIVGWTKNKVWKDLIDKIRAMPKPAPRCIVCGQRVTGGKGTALMSTEHYCSKHLFAVPKKITLDTDSGE